MSSKEQLAASEKCVIFLCETIILSHQESKAPKNVSNSQLCGQRVVNPSILLQCVAVEFPIAGR